MVPKGWEVLHLKDVASKIQDGNYGADYPKADEFVASGIPFLTSKVIGGIGTINPDKFDYIKEEKHQSLKKAQIVAGDILFTNRGANVGTIAIVPDYIATANIGPQLTLVRCNDCILKEYLFQFLRGSFFQKQIQQRDSGSAMNFFGIKDTERFKVLVPSLSEQKRIAQILSTWDKAISVTEKLLANSQQQKKALMEQLLTGKKRLGLPAGSYEFKITRYGSIPKDWDYPAIKEICTQVSEKNSAAVDHPVLSCSKYDGFVDSLKYFNKKVYSDDLSGYRLIHRGCFGFPSNHIEEGSIGLQNLYDTGIVSPIYVVFRASPTKVDNSYLYAVLKTDHYKQIFGAATNASVDRRGSLRWKEFNQIHVPLPPLKEQQKISAVLSAADAEITTLEKKLACLRDEKKALMQQLLTGKRRVKVDEAVAE
ncbi:restriction endonuclease subunit S [Escherichia coli]|uniref:restriction endonuclease subunit S n=1 Tax=Escherichia coli TaxID=562 RepID=UPI001CCD1647|nr:restriction endonuclease subunit S [Escherichia coli]HBN3722527.1 restriction endonuclease subunit S [Escherichia coli]